MQWIERLYLVDLADVVVDVARQGALLLSHFLLFDIQALVAILQLFDVLGARLAVVVVGLQLILLFLILFLLALLLGCGDVVILDLLRGVALLLAQQICVGSVRDVPSTLRVRNILV